MQDSLQIAAWSELFETAKTRKLQRLAWYHAPSGVESKGYRMLTRQGAKGFAALGVFQALCQTMATMRIDARKAGQFLNSDGSGMPVADVWEISRIPVAVGEAALPILAEIGWIHQLSATHLPSVRQSSANHLPIVSLQEEKRREGEGWEEEGSGGMAATATPTKPQAEILVEACPKPSLTVPVLTAAVRCLTRHKAKPFAELLAEVQTITTFIADNWTASEKLQFIPNAERFFEEDLWRRNPDEWRSKSKGRSRRAPIDTGGRKFEVMDLRHLTQPQKQ